MKVLWLLLSLTGCILDPKATAPRPAPVRFEHSQPAPAVGKPESWTVGNSGHEHVEPRTAGTASASDLQAVDHLQQQLDWLDRRLPKAR